MTNRDGGTGTSWAPCSLSLDGDDINWSLWPSISKETLRNPLEMFLALFCFVLFCWIFRCRIDEMMLMIVYLGEGNTRHAVFRSSSRTGDEQFSESAPASVISRSWLKCLCAQDVLWSFAWNYFWILRVAVFVFGWPFDHLQKEALRPCAATYAK